MLTRRSILTGGALLCASPALSHHTPSGAPYPTACCSDVDCHPIHDRDVTRSGDIWRVRTPDGVVTYGREHLRDPIDEGWHACWTPGTTNPLCLIPAAGGS